MFGSAVLEVATGLIFVFLLVSLICSAAGETISNLLKWRAVELEKGIRDLILGKLKDDELKKLVPKGLKKPVPEGSGGSQDKGKTLQDLYNHPLIKSLALKETGAQAALQKIFPSGLTRGDKPINIPPQTFVLALFDTFVPSAAGITKVDELRQAIKNNISEDSPLYKPLLALVTNADDKIEDARKKVENWFDMAMTQTTVIYKRNMWRLVVLIGIIASIVLNIDSIAITSTLWRQPALRASISAAATEYSTAANQQTSIDQSKVLNQVLTELNKLNLPIGWQVQLRPTLVLYPNDFIQPTQPIGGTAWLLKILGWLITGLAAAQGAPFWFDALQKITGKNTASPASAKS